MQILFLSGQYPPNTKGGAEISTHELAVALIAHGHAVSVVAEGQAKNEVLDGVSVFRRPLGLTKKVLIEKMAAKTAARSLQREFRLAEFDYIHAHDFRSALVVAELLRSGHITQSQAVVTIRDYAAISGDTNYILSDGSIPKNSLGFAAAWRSYRIAEVGILWKVVRFLQYVVNTRYRTRAFTAIRNRVYISHAQRREIQKYVKDSKHERVIYNPVRVGALSPVPSAPRALYIGRLETYKGIEVLLQAWKTVVSHVPKAHLQLVGDGAQRTFVDAFVTDNNLQNTVSVESFLPHEQMESLYARTALCIAPNLWIEPFGRTVAEAMAAGRIVMAANVGGPDEMVEHKKTGYVFERGSVQDLALAILEVFTADTDEQERMGVAAREWVVKHLDPATIAQQYEEFYLEVSRNSR